MKEFMKMTGQSISDVRESTMVNTQAIAKLEMQMGQLANHLGEREKGSSQASPCLVLRHSQLEILQILRMGMNKCNPLSHFGQGDKWIIKLAKKKKT
jgi:hypothetical protein